jgi:hypothetical protein
VLTTSHAGGGKDGAILYVNPKGGSRRWDKVTVVSPIDSEETVLVAHGIGTGNINGDGRIDILGAYGWWEQPPTSAGNSLWNYHPEAFGQ